MIIEPRRLEGNIEVPPSKSITHRAFILTCIAGGKVSNPLISEDTKATLGVLESMGAEFHWEGGTLVVDRTISHGSGSVDCKNSGTTLRLLTAVSCLFPETSELSGDDSLNSRPIGQLVMALAELGVSAESSGTPPVRVRGPFPPGDLECTVAGDISSQYISALLIALAARDAPSTIRISGRMVSKPYVDLTIQMLEDFGASIEIAEGEYRISAAALRPRDVRVSADFSSLAFFAVAGVLGDNRIAISGMDMRYPQADSRIVEIIEMFGGNIEWDDGVLRLSGGDLKGCDVDLGSSPDLFPIVSVLASMSVGRSRLFGAHHLRFKETDRIKAVVEMLEAVGVDIEETEDGCIIEGTGSIHGWSAVSTYGDHRIAMAATIAGTAAEKPVEIDDPDCVAVSFPNFFEVLDSVSK